MADSSPIVAARRAAMLPPLLAAVRKRRRRRHAVRASSVALLIAFVVVWSWPAPPRSPQQAPSLAPPTIVCRVVATDPTTLARLTVATRVRSEWFVDDEGLVGLLTAAARPAGIVRVRGAVSVAAAAVDPFSDGVP